MKMKRGALTFAGKITPGSAVVVDGETVVVDEVRRARGRKPKTGENLYLMVGDRVLKRNSVDPVRVVR